MHVEQFPAPQPTVSLAAQIASIVDPAIRAGVFAGAVIGVVAQDQAPKVVCAGEFRPGGRKMFPDAVFDVASITKVVPTSALALWLLQQKKFALDDPVRKFIPELCHTHADAILIRHLFTHTVDFGFRLSAYKDGSAQDILDAIFKTELKAPPGSTFFYSNATSILQGIVVERVSGRKLDHFAQDVLFDPLGMTRTTFHPELFDRSDVVPTEMDPWRRREICGEVHDESAWRLRECMIAGSAGVFSTVPDLMRFVQMILNGGRVGDAVILEPWIIDAMFTNQIGAIGMSAGLGIELNQPRYMGAHAMEVIGKTGFTGCVIMCSRKAGRGVVMLSNYTYPHRKGDAGGINEVRRRVADAVFG